MLALVLVLAACNPPLPEVDDTDPVDTDDTDDTDPVDTDTDVPVDVSLVVVPVVPADFSGAILGLYPLDSSFSAVTSDVPAVTAALVDGEYRVTFTPDEADLVEPGWAAGIQVAAYALVAGTGSAWVGAVRYDALYIVGQPPSPYSDIGLVEGWNLLWISGEEDPPVVGDPLAAPLEANLTVQGSVSVGGGWLDAVAGDRVAGFSTEDPTAQVGDAAAASPWAVSVSGEPALSTFKDLGGVRVAGFLLQAYTDADASGGWSDGDTITATAKASTGQDGYVAYGEPPDTLDEVHRLVTLGGFRVGWSAVRASEGAWPLTPAEATSLEMR